MNKKELLELKALSYEVVPYPKKDEQRKINWKFFEVAIESIPLIVDELLKLREDAKSYSELEERRVNAIDVLNGTIGAYDSEGCCSYCD